MSLSRRRAFFRARTGSSDANAQPIIDGLRGLGHLVVPIRSSEAGVPDLCVYPRDTHRGIARFAPVWLEIKTLTGKERDAQVTWRESAQRQGVRVAVVRTLAEALEALTR